MTILIVFIVAVLGKCALDHPEVSKIIGRNNPKSIINIVEEYDRVSMRLPTEEGECVNLRTEGYYIEEVKGLLIICKVAN